MRVALIDYRAGNLTSVRKALAAAGAEVFTPEAAAATQADDDAICRANGVAPGSDAYVACRKNRDAQRGGATDRLERSHRNLAERMLNGQ